MDIVEVSGVAFTTFQLSGGEYQWWEVYEEGRPADAAPPAWAQFSEMFLRECAPQTLRDAWRTKFDQLRRGTMTVSEYTIRFTELSRHTSTLVPTVREQIHRVIEDLSYGLRFSMARELETDTPFQQVVDIARRL
ncbi:uncharacterized protein [Nicotiana tomentosiformis]|uniref:uncharacterized protein n=1 Tax=Nicotiana tomentosiformis TaxID=4098 RepID=UPI00388CDD48